MQFLLIKEKGETVVKSVNEKTVYIITQKPIKTTFFRKKCPFLEFRALLYIRGVNLPGG